MAAKRAESEEETAKRVLRRRPRWRRRREKEEERMRRDHRRQTRERLRREEEGTRERHSRRRSSGREEIADMAAAEQLYGASELSNGVGLAAEEEMLLSLGLGKQDFMSHEKWRELQLSDISHRWIRF